MVGVTWGLGEKNLVLSSVKAAIAAIMWTGAAARNPARLDWGDSGRRGKYGGLDFHVCLYGFLFSGPAAGGDSGLSMYGATNVV